MNDCVSGDCIPGKKIILSNVEELERMVNITQQNCSSLRKSITKLEENLAAERKLKSGFKVIIASLSSENQLLRSKIIKKSKRNMEITTPAGVEGLEKISTNGHVGDKHIIKTSNSERWQNYISKQCSPSHLNHKNVSREALKIYPEKSSECHHPSFQSSESSTCDHLLMQVDLLTKRLQEKDGQLREAEERLQMMEIQMETYRADFMSERSDRENAMGKIMELEKELLTLRRLSGDQNHIGSHMGSLCESSSLQKQDFLLSTSTACLEDVLVARGNFSAFQERSHVLHFSENNSSSQSNDLDLKVDGRARLILSKETNLSSSSESLNLLTTEHGGDDYY